MPSKREAALRALFDRISAINGPVVERNAPEDRDVPPGGVVLVNDGTLREPEIYLSPLSYGHTAEAEIVVIVQHHGAAQRDEALDGLLGAIEAVIDTDPTLGGAVESAGLGDPVFATERVERGETVKAARLTAALEFMSSSPLG